MHGAVWSICLPCQPTFQVVHPLRTRIMQGTTVKMEVRAYRMGSKAASMG